MTGPGHAEIDSQQPTLARARRSVEDAPRRRLNRQSCLRSRRPGRAGMYGNPRIVGNATWRQHQAPWGLVRGRRDVTSRSIWRVGERRTSIPSNPRAIKNQHRFALPTPAGDLESRQDSFKCWNVRSKPRVELSRPSGRRSVPTQDSRFAASSLPSSTPHWSKQLMPQMAASTNTRCS